MTFTFRSLPERRRTPRPTAAQASVLADARQAQAEVCAAEARKLAAAVAWAALNEVTDPDEAANWGDASVTLAGEGAPLIAQSCVAEFAAVIGTTTGGGRAYLADALELAHRLPRLYAAVQAGVLPTWKARRIARETTVLSPGAAAELDVRIAPRAARLSAPATQRMIDETIARVMPEYAQDQADALWQQRVDVDHRQVSFARTSKISGALDLLDAQDLDDRLDRDAQALQDAGSNDTLDVRRAVALGMLARGESTSAGRQVSLVVHLPSDTATPTAWAEVGDGRLLTQAQVAAWCGNPGVKVVVKPVIDLHDSLSSRGYEVPDRIREHLELRDETCVFAYCTRPARHTQKDHIKPYDPDTGPTETDNLASLCQHHHNLKTHAGWTYTMVEPGVYLWRSPHGYAFLRDHEGTQDLGP